MVRAYRDFFVGLILNLGKKKKQSSIRKCWESQKNPNINIFKRRIKRDIFTTKKKKKKKTHTERQTHMSTTTKTTTLTAEQNTGKQTHSIPINKHKHTHTPVY